MQHRDRRRAAREARAQPFSTSQVDINTTEWQERQLHRSHFQTEETVAVHRKWEHEMKEREAIDPKALEACKKAMESVVISTP